MRIWKFVAKDFIKQNSEDVSSHEKKTNIDATRSEDINISTMDDDEIQNNEEQQDEMDSSSGQVETIESSSEGAGSSGEEQESEKLDSVESVSNTEEVHGEEQISELDSSSGQVETIESSSEGSGSSGEEQESEKLDTGESVSNTEGVHGEEQISELDSPSGQVETIESSSEGSGSSGEERGSEKLDTGESVSNTEGVHGEEQISELDSSSGQEESIESSSEVLNDSDDMEQSHEMNLNEDGKVQKKMEEKVDNSEIDLDDREADSDENVNENSETLSIENNQFLQELNELPSFKDRERGDGYSIDTDSITELPDSLVRTLIIKFLNQRFCNKTSDLNHRSTDLEKSYGFYKWDLKKVIFDYTTYQYPKVLHDKYGYQYANGRFQNVPLSFYFDMSASMNSYTNMLAVLAIELLKKDVKVLIGFNERVNVQIDSLNQEIDVSELASILYSAGYNPWQESSSSFKKDSRVEYKFVNQDIDQYLIEKKAEKCVVFADFDPLIEVIRLSQNTDVYWFCFESDFESYDLVEYKGFFYPVQDANDIVHGLIKVNERRFENLCFVENPKVLKKGGEKV